MQRMIKICFVEKFGFEPRERGETFVMATKTIMTLDDIKNHVVHRKPELKNQPLKIYYRGNCDFV